MQDKYFVRFVRDCISQVLRTRTPAAGGGETIIISINVYDNVAKIYRTVSNRDYLVTYKRYVTKIVLPGAKTVLLHVQPSGRTHKREMRSYQWAIWWRIR